MLTIEYLTNLLKSHELLTYNLKIFTITTTFKLNVTLDIENIKNIVSAQNIFVNPPFNPLNKNSNVYLLKNRVSLLLPQMVNSKKGCKVKLFKNGSVQMTCCKNEHEIFHVIQKLNEANIIDVNQIDISSIKIIMINAKFDHDLTISTDILTKQLQSDSYDASIYAFSSVIHIKIDIGRIMIFPGGRIVISGKNNCLSVLDLYKFITEYLSIHCNKSENLIKSVNVMKSKSKSKSDGDGDGDGDGDSDSDGDENNLNDYIMANDNDIRLYSSLKFSSICI